MAIKLAVENTRVDMYLLNPEDINLDEAANGRWQPHTDQSIQEMVDSYKENGQLQAVIVRKDKEGKVYLVLGYRRVKAALLYNEQNDEKMKVKCVISQLNAEEIFLRNITENLERAETTIVDDAYNMRKLREDLGWTDTKIAGLYKKTPSYVCQLKRIIDLPLDIQMKLHLGELSLASAITVGDLSEEDRTEVLAAGNSTASVTKAAREKKIKVGGKVTRTMAEMKKFFEGFGGDIGKLFLDFAAGKITDEAMTDGLDRILVK